MFVSPLVCILLILSTAEVALGLSLPKVPILRSRACHPATAATWLPYTGTLIQREIEYNLRDKEKVKHHVVVTHCKRGTVEYEMEKSVAASIDVTWNETFCLDATAVRSEDGLYCTKLARRKKYALRQVSIYRPGALVGGLFQCESNGDRCIPTQPLIADSILGHWVQLDGRKLAYRIPYFRTPDIVDRFYAMNSDWSMRISENEQYDYNVGGDARNILDRSSDSAALMLAALIQDAALSEDSYRGAWMDKYDAELRDGLKHMMAYVNAYLDQWR